jgi:hypothetical protein
MGPAHPIKGKQSAIKKSTWNNSPAFLFYPQKEILANIAI